MAFIPVPNTVRVSLEFIFAGSTVVVTLTFTKGTAWTSGNLSTLVDNVLAWWGDNIKGIQTSAVTLNAINVLDLSSSSAPSYTRGITTANVGTAVGNPMPSNAALVVSFLTALRGRSYRGRMYLPGLSENQQTDASHLNSTFSSSVAAAAAVINSYMTVTGAVHAIASKFAGNAPRVTGVATPVNGYRTDNIIDSQRRRLAGRGT